jgi:hypothetical protein
MSKTRSFRLAMAALAVTIVAAIALIGSPAPALAGMCVPPAPPQSCADVDAYCVAYCTAPLCNCGPYGTYQACVDANNTSFQCAPPSTTTGTCTDDGRVNQNCSAPEIVYCDEDEVDFFYYNYADLDGEYDFSVPTDALLVSVEETTLVWQDGAVRIYLNPDGTVTMYAPQTDAKTYFLRFDPFQCAPMEEGAEWGL